MTSLEAFDTNKTDMRVSDVTSAEKDGAIPSKFLILGSIAVAYH